MGKKKKKKKEQILSTGFGPGLSHINFNDLDDQPMEERNKYKKPDKVTGPCSYEQMLRDAENFEGYLEIVEKFAILKNVSPKNYEAAVSEIKKMIRLLREGKGDKVYDKERYEEYMERLENRGF